MQKYANIKDLRIKTHMNRVQFAEYLKIPYRTIQDWELNTRKCPDYIIELIEYKLQNEKLI